MTDLILESVYAVMTEDGFLLALCRTPEVGRKLVEEWERADFANGENETDYCPQCWDKEMLSYAGVYLIRPFDVIEEVGGG